MKQYQFKIILKGIGCSAGEAWQDAVDKFVLDPKDFEKYNESQPGTEVAIIDVHGNILGEGFLVIQPKNPFLKMKDSDITNVLDSELTEV
jgi:hypothetical protein